MYGGGQHDHAQAQARQDRRRGHAHQPGHLAGLRRLGGGEGAAFAATRFERELSASIMREGAKLERRTLDAGEALITQGEEGQDLFLLLDGVVDVEIDGDEVAELGPGALIGEMALLEDAPRSADVLAEVESEAVRLH